MAVTKVGLVRTLRSITLSAGNVIRMRCTFLGVGEAFDEQLANTSLLIEGRSVSAMLDCGFTAPPQLWRSMAEPLRLDIVWISHFHGDHWFGLPWLMVRMHEEGRRNPLVILGPKEIGSRVRNLAEMAYPGIMEKLCYDLVVQELKFGERFEYGEFSFRCAASNHSVKSQAVRVDSTDGSIVYSGDGSPTPDTAGLARGCDLLVQEAYALRQGAQGHGSVEQALGLALEAGAKTLALVHLGRRTAHGSGREAINSMLSASEQECIVPSPGDVLTISAAAKGET